MRHVLSFLVPVLALSSAVAAQDCVPQTPVVPMVKAPIHDVVFASRNQLLPDEKEREIADWALHETFPPEALNNGLSAVADEVAERVRAEYYNEGYFDVALDAKAIRSKVDESQYDIIVQVHDGAVQYRLGDVNFERVSAFPESELRDLFPIQRGEIFSREKVAKGLEELRTLYSSQGYINATSVPKTEFEERTATLNLTITIDEGKQFRWRGAEILGVDPETKTRILDAIELRPGDVFNPEAWQRSLLKFPDLSKYPPPTGGRKLDEHDGWVDMVLDFKPRPACPISLSGASAIQIREPAPAQ